MPQAGRVPTAVFQDSFGALGREWATLVGAPALEGLDAKTALFDRNQYLWEALSLISPDGLARPMLPSRLTRVKHLRPHITR